MTRPALAPLVLVACLAGGCLLANEGADERLRLADGGLDADAAADRWAPDASDGGDGCPPPGCRETSCTNGQDDDGDGIVDCADFDCTDFPGCCDEGTTLVSASWDPEVALIDDWLAVPTGTPYPGVEATETDGGTEEGSLQSFESTMPSGIVHRSCQPLALGARLQVTMEPLGAASCTDTACDRFAAVVLTAAQDALPGRRLLDDLAVTVQADGAIRVTQGGRTLGETSVELSPEGRVDLDIDVTPGVDDRGRPALFATAHVTDRQAGSGAQKLLERVPFLLQRDLVTAVAACEKVPGLFLGVEGQGDRVRVGPLTMRARRCVNPGQFGTPSDETATLTSDRLDLGAWAEGGLGAPALASTCAGSEACWSGDGSPGVRWDLLVEGTNVDPALDRFTHVGWSLGHAMSTQWDASLGWITDPAGEPKAGDDPPTCLDETTPDGGVAPCEGARSVRDPAVWPFTTDTGQVDPTDGLVVAYAREWEDAVQRGERGVFALHVQAVSANPDEPFAASEGRRWTPDDAGCDSLREPEVAPASGSPSTDGHWLLYTCERSGQPDVVHALPLSGLFIPKAGATPRVVLDPSELGSHAAGGVRGAEVLVVSDLQNTAQPPLLRTWFVARDAIGRESIGLAQGRSETFDRFPTLHEYRGSPVLRVDDGVLGGDCGEGCDLVGFDVVRRADDPRATDAPQTIRLLVARRVDGVDYELVPLEQLWRPPQ
ncbi:MAG: hypothetical protein ACOCV4_05570 [Myxococcota bacterium]